MFAGFDPEKDKAAVEAAASDQAGAKRNKWSEEFAVLPMYMNRNGQNFIDMIPFMSEENFANLRKGEPNWRLIYKQHVNVGPNRETIVCPRCFGERCPICDAYDEVRFNFPGEKGSKENKEYYTNVVKPLQPKARALYSVVDRKDKESSDKGVQYFDMATFYIEENIDAYAKDRRGEPIFYMDADDGRIINYEWIVDEEARKKGQQSAPDFKIVGLLDRELPLEDGTMEAYQVSDEELEMVKPLGKWVFNIASYDEIKEMMEGSMVTTPASKESTDEQLDDAFGKRMRPEEDDDDSVPFEVEKKEKKEEKTVEKPSRSRSRASKGDENPVVQKINALATMEDVDAYCEENEIDVFADEFDSLEDFKVAVLEFALNK
jgi:hypothetical protein